MISSFVIGLNLVTILILMKLIRYINLHFIFSPLFYFDFFA